MLVFEALPAHNGDCLLLHYGTAATPRLAVIDGGPKDVYGPALKPRLAKLKADRGLAASAALPIDLLVVSHIDDDHIRGVLDLMGEMTDAQDSHAALPYRVRNAWHNSFDDVLGTTPDELQAAISSRWGTAGSADAVLAITPTLSRDAAKVLASVKQGRDLRDAIKKLGVPLNKPFSGLVMQTATTPSKKTPLEGGISLTLIGPQKAQLQALQDDHDDYLKKNHLASTSGQAALAAFSDTSVPNLSSIVLHVKHKNGTILLTGDARGDYVLAGLDKAGLLKSGHCDVDVLKLPHHGSDNNVTKAFFEQVRATHYVASGDGEYGNPERETLTMLFEARAGVPAMAGTACTIHLTYPVADIDAGRKADWNAKFAAGKKTRKWSDSKDSLRTFFDDAKKSGAKFTLVAAKQPVRVEL